MKLASHLLCGLGLGATAGLASAVRCPPKLDSLADAGAFPLLAVGVWGVIGPLLASDPSIAPSLECRRLARVVTWRLQHRMNRGFSRSTMSLPDA